jgi:hypothetical protein
VDKAAVSGERILTYSTYSTLRLINSLVKRKTPALPERQRNGAERQTRAKEHDMKRAVLLSFTLFIGAGLSAQNSADFQYTVENGAVTITGYTGSAKNVTIPERINGMAVTKIGFQAFADKQLTGITIPNSVTVIGNSAFENNQLTSVTILDSVATIGGSAFEDNQLTSIIIPSSVTTIGYGTFQGNQLTSVTIPNSVTIIESRTFSENPLASVTMPANVTITVDGFFASFPGNFGNVYTSGGNRAGTYRSNDGGETWARQQ